MIAPPGQLSDTLSIYFHEIDDVRLLSREEEISLADEVAKGNHDARERMICANLRLVVAIARQSRGRGVTLEDLVAEGNLGLMRAVEGFDPSNGSRFATYAAFWIKQSLRAAVQRQGTSVRMPGYTHSLRHKWYRASERLSASLGREPTDEEVGLELRLSKRKLQVALESLRAAKLTFAALDDSDSHVPDGSIGSEQTASPGSNMERTEASALLAACVTSLENREATVIRLRFGLNGAASKNLREIGAELGMTREQARRIEKKAIRHLRALKLWTPDGPFAEWGDES